MAIEIILRDDVSDYEPHPVFGLTYRGVGTLATCAALGYLTYNLLAPLGWDYRSSGSVILVVCALVAWVGFARPKGLRVERYLLAAAQDYLAPRRIGYATPVVTGASDKRRKVLEGSMPRKVRKAARKESEIDELS